MQIARDVAVVDSRVSSIENLVKWVAGFAAVGVVAVVGAAVEVGSFKSSTPTRSEVAPVTVVAKVEENTKNVIDVKSRVEALDEKVDELHRSALGKIDLLLQAHWERSNVRGRRAMKRNSERIEEATGTDPLSGIEE